MLSSFLKAAVLIKGAGGGGEKHRIAVNGNFICFGNCLFKVSDNDSFIAHKLLDETGTAALARIVGL